jgi:hypothetical protein
MGPLIAAAPAGRHGYDDGRGASYRRGASYCPYSSCWWPLWAVLLKAPFFSSSYVIFLFYVFDMYMLCWKLM